MNKLSPTEEAGRSALCAIGVDVGGTKIAAGLVAFPEGTVRARRVQPTAPQRGGAAVLEDVGRLSEELAAEGRLQRLGVDGIGIGVCELVDLAGQVVSANCIGWHNLPVSRRLSAHAPVIMEADVRAAALGEALFGAGKPFKNFLYFTIGTGISCALVLDGKPFTGARGLTGTMASSPLPDISEMRGDKVTPTLEQFASGPALVARYNQRSSKVMQSAEEVLAVAKASDPMALDVVQSAAGALGASVGILVSTLDPEAVIVGGGLGSSGGLYWDGLVASTRRHIWSALHRELPILPAALGRDAGIIGAAATAWKKLRANSVLPHPPPIC